MSLKLTTLIVIICLATKLHATEAGDRYESSQRLWYPREALKDGGAAYFDRHHYRQTQQASRPLRISVGLKSPSMSAYWTSPWAPNNSSYTTRAAGSDQYDKRAASRRRYAYMMSPLSEQILEVGALQKDGRQSVIDWPPSAHVGQQDLGARPIEPQEASFGGRDACQTLNSVIMITRDDVDLVTGQLVRNCKGLVQVNRCEGSCGSFVQPSIKSHTGLKKECSCCNEGSFRRIQIRLNECYWAVDNRRITATEDEQRSYMEIGLDEPIECKCRQCDSTI